MVSTDFSFDKLLKFHTMYIDHLYILQGLSPRDHCATFVYLALKNRSRNGAMKSSAMGNLQKGNDINC
jgi:hypothetical protein